jgi:putative endonuclease
VLADSGGTNDTVIARLSDYSVSSSAKADDPVFQRRLVGARSYYVYILASRLGGALDIGVTNDLVRRVYEHREKQVEGFTKKYGVDKLVYFEQFHDAENAIKREKRLKRWNRAWKIRLIQEHNPNWDDLYLSIAGA